MKTKDYTIGYKHLCDQYAQIQRGMNDMGLNTTEKQKAIILFPIPKNGNTLKNLKDVKEKILPKLQELMSKKEETKASDSNIKSKVLDMLIERFTDSFNRVVEDIKLECMQKDLLESLLSLINPQEINKVEADGDTLLMKATLQPYPPKKIIEFLLKNGADPFITCRFEKTPFSEAISKDNLGLTIAYLKQKSSLCDTLDRTKLSESVAKLSAQDSEAEVYKELAKMLHKESEISKILGLTEGGLQSCYLDISQVYESLGQDSEVLFGSSEG